MDLPWHSSLIVDLVNLSLKVIQWQTDGYSMAELHLHNRLYHLLHFYPMASFSCLQSFLDVINYYNLYVLIFPEQEHFSEFELHNKSTLSLIT